MTTPMPSLTASVQVEVPFHDIDPMGVAWHGHYFKYFEIARCALLDEIDYNYPQMKASGYMWPIVDTRVKYVGSALFQQTLNVTATLLEYENRLKIGYDITEAQSGQRLTKGYTIQVAVDIHTREMCYVSPKILLDKLGVSA